MGGGWEITLALDNFSSCGGAWLVFFSARVMHIKQSKTVYCISVDSDLDTTLIKSKEEGKDQESIRSNTTPYPRHGKVTKHTKTHHIQESPEVSHFPAGENKGARNIQDNILRKK